ncbi:MAG TPA: T9SS type A sorting domain-containing protein [Candidatus Kapabacteria bacterium]|jgi:hypothetical protein|nr:T9SS type A sorting domain-containing protein [Candidatus Kapabacteria bacterium]
MVQSRSLRRNLLLLFINVFVAFTLHSISIGNVRCQTHWKMIKPQSWFESGFFLNRDYGIIAATTDGSTQHASSNFIFRTTNAGLSWNTPSNSPFLDRVSGEIRTIFMRDSLNGWFTFYQDNFLPGAYFNDIEHNGIHRTMDGGLSWIDLQDSAQWNAVYEASPGNLIVGGGGIAFEDAQRGMVSVSERQLNKNRFQSTYGDRTTDGGQTWSHLLRPYTTSNGADSGWDSWGIYCQKNAKTYYMYPEGPGNVGVVSNDFGNTWRRFSVGAIGGGDVEGAGDAVYIQTISGFYRTTDRAQTNVPVGGPSGGGDTRFMVPSKCNGAVVVAFGYIDSPSNYGVWMTTDGGDGTIPLPADTLTIARAAFDTISSCDTALASILFANCGCTPADYHFDSVRVVGDGRFSVVSAPAFPTQWNGFASRDSLHLRFAPDHQSGAAQGTLHLYGRIIRDSVETPFDSIISLSAYASSVGPSLKLSIASSALNFGTVDICTGSDTTIRITNSGCGGPLKITAEELAADGFDVTQLSLPITLANDSSIVLHVHAVPTDTVPLAGTILLRAMADSITRDFTVDLHAAGVWNGSKPLAISDSANFHLVSLCNTDSLLVSIYNAGCDSMRVDTAWVAGDSDFSIATNRPLLLGANNTTRYTLYFHPLANGSRSALLTLQGHDRHGNETRRVVSIPVSGVGTSSILVVAPQSVNNVTGFCSLDTLTATISNSGCDSLRVSSALAGEGYLLLSGDTVLAPNVSGTYRILFTPHTQKGANAGSLNLHFTSLATDSTKDTTIALVANVGDGVKALAASPDSANLGAVYVCQQRDTVIWLKNTGCDTLHIISGQFDSSHGINTSYGTDANYPITIPPGDSVQEKIFFTPDTSGHPLSISGNFTITSDANSGQPTQTIPLTTSIVYPVHLTLSLLKTDSAADGSIIKFYLVANWDSPPTPGMISALHFDLMHDDDILSYLSENGLALINSSSSDSMMTQSFTVSPIPLSDTIGTLTFQVYLTKDSTTPLTLSNITFDTPSGLSPDCIASVDDSGAEFSYIYLCGDRTLQHFMQTGTPFTIESIVPNPAQTEITVRLGGAAVGAHHAGVIAYILSDALGRAALWGEDIPGRLNVRELPSGVYYLRLSQNGFVLTRRVVIQK